MEKDKSLPGFKIPTPIPQIMLGVSVDTYYNFQKDYSPGFTWSFEIAKEELYQVEQDLMDFLAHQTTKRQMDSISLFLVTVKLGASKQKEIRIEYVKKTQNGWLIGDTY